MIHKNQVDPYLIEEEFSRLNLCVFQEYESYYFICNHSSEIVYDNVTDNILSKTADERYINTYYPKNKRNNDKINDDKTFYCSQCKACIIGRIYPVNN